MITRQVLCAEEGMLLTDGNTYGTVIYLAVGANASEYWEITKEEYEKILQEQEQEVM